MFTEKDSLWVWLNRDHLSVPFCLISTLNIMKSTEQEVVWLMMPPYCQFLFMRKSCVLIYTFLLFNQYLNGFVELLRVIQRLNLKEQWNDLSLHFITLCTLQSTVSGTRAQNHLRSIGGLEILLDGLGLPSSKFSVLKHSSISRNERCIF